MGSFSFTQWGITVAIATVAGAILGGLLSLLVEILFGKKLSEKVKSVLIFGGAVVGYAIIKVMWL